MRSRHLALVALALASLSRGAVAQDAAVPGIDTVLAALRSDVVYRGPTLVVLIPLPPDSIQQSAPAMDEWRAAALKILEAARTVADPAGFQVVARDPRYANLMASGGGTVYSAPRNVTTGYILVAPLKQSRLQRGYLEASELEALLASYLNPMHPLAL